METIEKSVEVLRDLIEINTDRVSGFSRALKDLAPEDNDLRNLFTMFAQDSRDNIQELGGIISQLGENPETGSSALGTIHRTWLDIRATISGQDRKSILDECERGEDAIKKAYQDALKEENLSIDIVSVLTQQQQKINEGHDRVKALRDAAV
ncbi:aldehyde dehydrogenase [Mucilaginibacter hurinus]|uniref:Aldehyde dehydrogenase n=1 Tax=Mucilaginibacter hurinus TaxID=2201324 RepID=A0A367GM55_9SPHI|nr:PA2169 family four-helix-bundle protein [Mucilaginibacter hurinus]RCH54539.1 aldehyde dehydrogenase [Mucilaginibacter hurinus]